MKFFTYSVVVLSMSLLFDGNSLFAEEIHFEDLVRQGQVLETDLRNAMIEETILRGELSQSIETADDLIETAADIRAALRLSCELAGSCLDNQGRISLDELHEFPEYDEAQGYENARLIRMGRNYYEN